MSRSNPVETLPHPAVRWMEWNGEKGVVKYYDKDTKQNVELGDKMTFLLLDQLATIKGWNDPSDSAIYSNEVRNTSTDILSVKSFKGGEIASGLYKDIKDKVKVNGGHFTANLYVAVKIDGTLKIASLQFKGAALNSWVDFAKESRGEIYSQAISITGYTESSKGRTIFRMPVFALTKTTEETDNAAKILDQELQEYLGKKLPAKAASDEGVQHHPEETPQVHPQEVIEDDLPF